LALAASDYPGKQDLIGILRASAATPGAVPAGDADVSISGKRYHEMQSMVGRLPRPSFIHPP
jgi:hypothetical protein